MAAQFPAEPTPQEQADIRQFFKLFGQLYPCEECAGHFRGMLAEYPVQSGSNLELSQWMCKLHNFVNERLGHEQFSCAKEDLQERWGDCGCFEGSSGEEDATGADGAVATASSE